MVEDSWRTAGSGQKVQKTVGDGVREGVISRSDARRKESSDVVRNLFGSGFQYGFTFEETAAEDDWSFDFDGVTLLIDPMSSQYLQGAEVDYTESLQGSQFSIKNPNAQTSCGCGSSFSV